MSSPQSDDDDVEDVEFVSEGPTRPVLECIDLRSGDEDEGCSSAAGTLDDEIACQKKRVESTLDRLAQRVAMEKKERAQKCRAFKEKQILQKAHGQRELAFNSANGVNLEAKRCVDMWLKMPGIKPGGLHSGSRKRQRPDAFPMSTAARRTCPVINCGRVYDNASLLDGHLKRFDHSPCDPTIHLKGCPAELFACPACALHFETKEKWRRHLEFKVSSSSPDGHSATLRYQRIVCFACPACYLFFNLRDECLQHMSAKNHFTVSLPMAETKVRPLPVPIPQSVKNRLVTLCKDVAFNVRCSICHKVLTSHQTAQAHFNVHCRQGCAVAKADKTVVQVMEQLQVWGQCSVCCKLFPGRAEIEKHTESTQHQVEVNKTMEKALLQHCRFSESQPAERGGERGLKRQSADLDAPLQSESRNHCDESRPRPRRPGAGRTVTAWLCECGLRFSQEAAASKHLLDANQIFHRCGVCGKLMGESSITRLHMSRFHGGAHLSNFLFHCRRCDVEMPRREDILSHVSEAHAGHTYFTERELPVEAEPDAKPSTSGAAGRRPRPSPPAAAPPPPERTTWMCRMCEELFDSEEEVERHCGDVGAHSFQRFMCGHCPQKFFKESTVRRHCANEHGGQTKSFYYCGLCDSMQFDSEGEFAEHYKRIHARDYCRTSDGGPTEVEVVAAASDPCPCMASEKSQEEAKATYTRCMRQLASEGKCQYLCAPCGVSAPSYAQIKTHVHTKHPALNLDTTFDIQCRACPQSFDAVPTFHQHYHRQHCALEPCASSRGDAAAEHDDMEVLDATEIKPEVNEIDDESLVEYLNMEQPHRENDAQEGGSDDVMSMSAEDESESADLEEALKRSLLEF